MGDGCPRCGEDYGDCKCKPLPEEKENVVKIVSKPKKFGFDEYMKLAWEMGEPFYMAQDFRNIVHFAVTIEGFGVPRNVIPHLFRIVIFPKTRTACEIIATEEGTGVLLTNSLDFDDSFHGGRSWLLEQACKKKGHKWLDEYGLSSNGWAT